MNWRSLSTSRTRGPCEQPAGTVHLAGEAELRDDVEQSGAAQPDRGLVPDGFVVDAAVFDAAPASIAPGAARMPDLM